MENRFRAWQHGLPAAVRLNIMAPCDGEQRMVTMLFVAFSGAGSDPAAGTEESRQDSLRDALVQVLSFYEGRIDRFSGDGVLAVFGTPAAHEDDPERAVLAALQLREKARALGFEATTAITTGQVSSGQVGADEHHEITAMAPAVSLAVRIPGAVRPGTVVIDDATRGRVSGVFELARILPRISGIAAAVAAWRVERRRGQRVKQGGTEGPRSSVLVGRDREMALLRKALDEVTAGSGRVVTVLGEAGIGKSRLLAELRAHARADVLPHLWLEGRCRELGMTSPYLPFVDILVQQFGLQQSGDARRSARLREALDELVGSGTITADRCRELGPLLGRLLSVRYGTEWDEKLVHAAPEQVKHQTLEGLRDLLLAVAGGRPAVIVLDDLHWADALSLELVSLLMESLAHAPLLLVCLYRPERESGCRDLGSIASQKCPGRCMEILLKELTREQSDLLIRSLLPVDILPASARESVLARTQGNPFFVEEVIRSLIESGVVYQDAGQWRARDDAAAVPVPERVQSVIRSRVDRLEPRLKRLLETAAVVGRVFRRDVLEPACDLLPSTADLAALEERALISREEADGTYSFRHVLTQQTVYLGIQRRRRGAMHRRAAQALESLSAQAPADSSDQLAFHYERAGDLDAAVRYLLRAGRRAGDAWLNEGALGHYHRALALLSEAREPGGASRAEALREMGRVYEVMGRHDLAEARLREAVQAGTEAGLSARELARTRYLLCKTLTARHRPDEYLPVARENLESLRGDPDCTEALETEFVIAYGAFDRGDFSAFCEYADRRGELIRSMPWSQETAINCGLLAWAWAIRKEEVKAEEWLGWLEREAVRCNDQMILAAVSVRRGRDFLAQHGDCEGAIAAIRRGARLYGLIGARYLQARCNLYAGDVLYRFGRLDEAEAERERAGALCSTLEPRDHLFVESRLLRGQIALGRGRAAEARRTFEEALAGAPGEQWEWLLRYLIGCSRRDQGDLEGASRSFMDVLGSTIAFRVPPAYSLSIDLAQVLSLLEACLPQPEFRATCELIQRKRPGAAELLSRWHLAPARAGSFPRTLAAEEFRSAPDAAWRWHDPYGDCGYATGDGLRMRARVGRSLRSANLSAPRLLRGASGDFAVEVATGAGPGPAPCIGGILVWKDQKNYLRLDRGSMAPDTVSVVACICNAERTIGRGRITGDVRMRLERAAGEVRALCRADGGEWYLVGRTPFAAECSLEVGLFSEGAVRPEIYPRTYGAGAEIVFKELTFSAPA